MEIIKLEDIKKISKEDLVNKIIVFHTDTVYGVGGLYGDEVSAEKIYEMKKRSQSKLLPVLCGSVEQVKMLTDFNDEAHKLSKHWPGALTMILKKKNTDETLAVRIPNSKIALTVLNHFGPLSTTSVNISGEKEVNSVEEIIEKFSEYIDYIVSDEMPLSETPSTIVDVTTEDIKIIRQGSIIIP